MLLKGLLIPQQQELLLLLVLLRLLLLLPVLLLLNSGFVRLPPSVRWESVPLRSESSGL